MHHKLILLTAAWACVGVLWGCASDRLGTKMSSWQGSHIDNVVARWGAPDRCSEEAGQQICIWDDGGVFIDNGGTSLQFGAISRPRCSRMLAINDDGYVTGWRWRGDGCDMSGRNVLAKNEIGRPSAVAGELELTEEAATTTARQ